MPLPQLRSASTRRLRRGVRATVVPALAAGAVGVAGVLASTGAAVATVPAAPGTAPSYDRPTTVRVSSFNTLGAGHTGKGGRSKFADGVTRTGYMVRILDQLKPSVVGLQEFQKPQFQRFKQLTKSTWGIFPGDQLSSAAMQNSIIWRRSSWTLVESHTMKIPYFHGNELPMPYVLLRNVQTGRQLWVYNSHQPADARGNAQKWRNIAAAREVALVNRLRAQYPLIPVIVTGDKNDRDAYFCRVARDARMSAAAGGGLVGDRCQMPTQARVDWVMGSPGLQFVGYQMVQTPLVKRTTDHPVIIGDALLPSAESEAAGITNVVVVDAPGLTAQAVRSTKIASTPALHDLMAEGAFALNARSDATSASPLGGAVSILTGRPTELAAGGTGVGTSTDPGTTVAAAAGAYVPSVFDVAHDHGMRTAFFGDVPGDERIVSSYDVTNGAPDTSGVSSGTNKIDTSYVGTSDADVVSQATASLTDDPAHVTFVHLRGLMSAGNNAGYTSATYGSAVAAFDSQVAALRSAIDSSSTLAGHTLLVVTADVGGTRQSAPETRLTSYRIPIIVAGPGVAPHATLYNLNRQYARPVSAQLGNTGPQPLRGSAIANLVTKYLGLPPVEGSVADPGQLSTLLPPPAG
ncbi:alkaline phosphatase family protein [Nocardioides sp.]|uniref:alkaline phosphatase family protein n=1 Tax=Nocardioides sp. TaxID=35761 RepID=UPI0037850B10